MNDSRVRGIGAALATAVAAASLAFAAAARPNDSPGGASAPPPPAAGAGRQLALVEGGIARPLAPGEAIEFGRDLVATITLVGGEDSHDVLLVRLRDRGGSPVSDATLRAVIEMRYMEHGRAQSVGTATGAGAYAVPIVFAMPGEWRIELKVTAASIASTIRLDVDEFR